MQAPDPLLEQLLFEEVEEKVENCFSTSVLLQSGHFISSLFIEKNSFSNLFPHFLQTNSNKGIIPPKNPVNF
jgi:hypothetical protein